MILAKDSGPFRKNSQLFGKVQQNNEHNAERTKGSSSCMWQLLILAAVPCLSLPPYANVLSKCKPSNDPNADCYGAYFVESDGAKRTCMDHKECYDYREPIQWCRLSPAQKWTQEGCHCDFKLQTCVMNRESYGRLEYTHCRLASNWYCP